MIGGFGILTFEVSEDNIKSIDGQLSRTLTAKISEHNAINGIGMIRHQGRELQEISFKMSLISQDKVNPVNELAKITLFLYGIGAFCCKLKYSDLFIITLFLYGIGAMNETLESLAYY